MTQNDKNPGVRTKLFVANETIGIGKIKLLQLIGETVRDRVGQSISVGVLREGNKEVITLNLTPRRWHGTGLLGCHIIPSN